MPQMSFNFQAILLICQFDVTLQPLNINKNCILKPVDYILQ